MTDKQFQQLKDAGFAMKDHMRSGVVLTEEESSYCLNAIEIGNRDNLELKRRYAEVASKHGLPDLPEGFHYGSGSSLTLNIFANK